MPTAARACPACHTPLPEEAQFCLRCGAATPADPGAPAPTAPVGSVEVTRVRQALADRYRVERILGEGGMATVYLAEDLRHKRRVALKVMRPELSATLGAERFLREIEIAAQLSHPHILPVYDSGDADGVLYYVMPYVEGGSLRERLEQGGQLPMDEALRLAREVTEALAYAHERGIIHRDIKPANILLGAGHALVADFGIARALGTDATLTQTGLAVGTPQYMSPQQAAGDRDVDARADVYAVGGVLYEMLAGEPPYSGGTPQAILAQSLTQDPPPLATRRPNLPPAVPTIVSQAMARAPVARFQTATALATALAQAADAARSGTAPSVSGGPSAARVGGMFGVAAAAALAVIYAVMRQLGLPPWVFALGVGLLAIGVPVLLLTRRVEARRLAGREVRGLRRLLTWQTAIGGGVLALMFWAAVATVLVARRAPAAADAGGAKRLAVLPFTNRGAPDDAYFVDGIADQVRGKLTGLGEFRVTAGTSSDQYRGTTKSPQEIGHELGVDYLLTATVSWAKTPGGPGRVQVVPELIDARTGAATWQQTFDADLTDVFQVQGDIAVRVAGALNVALGSGEQQELTARPTENLAAYDAFLKAEEARRTGGQTAARRAVNLYEQAVAIDSTFALAWARLAQTFSTIHFSTPSPEAAEGARSAAEHARALAPKAPETYMALGSYYTNVRYDIGRARQEYAEGLQLAPNDPGLLVGTATTDRSLGEWEQSVELLRRARALDPRSIGGQTALATNLLWLRRYDDAMAETDRGLALAPNNVSLIETKAMIHLARGDLPGARAVFHSAPADIEPTRLVAFAAATWDLFWALDDDQQRLLLRLSPGAFDDDRGAWALALAATYTLRGDAGRARAYGDSARLVYEEQLRASPDDNYLLALSAVALAYSGRNDEAVRNGERSLALLPVTTDAFSGAYNQHLLARVYAQVGAREKAIDQLEVLLRIPYYLSPGWLRIDPTFASLKGNPRFERLVKGSTGG
jgi:TolB-like protein/tetratricopeptide (TPR) repeat protein/tRNA A-37 threonylcarbamoyl transferase component Bud32